VLYAGLLGLGVMSLLVVPHPWLVLRMTLVAGGLQVVASWLAGLRGEIGWALVNAVALTLLASLAGGWPAGLAAVGTLGLIGLALAFDHFERALAAQRAIGDAWVRLAFGEALLLVGPATAALALFLALFPPRPHPGLASALEVGLQAGVMRGAYGILILICFVGGLAFYLASQLVRRENKLPPLDETVEAVRLGEEVLEAPDYAGPGLEYSGPRERIVRAYVGFLKRAARLGLVRRSHQTPWEFLKRLLVPPVTLSPLTDLFVGARYGHDDPSEADATRAEHWADEAAKELRRARKG
jgi:hypothetical protein